MADFKNQNRDAKPESASNPQKHGFEQWEREHASQIDKSKQDDTHGDRNARGDRNPGNFQKDRDKASDAGRKGGQR